MFFLVRFSTSNQMLLLLLLIYLQFVNEFVCSFANTIFPRVKCTRGLFLLTQIYSYSTNRSTLMGVVILLFDKKVQFSSSFV